MSLTGNVGRVALFPADLEPAVLNQRVAKILPRNDLLLSRYIFALLNTDDFEKASIEAATGVAQANVSPNWVKTFTIPLPPVDIQKEIVAEIEAEERLVDGNRQLIERMEQKIAAVIDRVWGERQWDENEAID